MKRMITILSSCLLVACGTPPQTEMIGEPAIVPDPPEAAPPMDPQLIAKSVEAKVIYEPFVNKAGKLIEGVGDYFLVYDDQNWFIKFSAGSVLREDIAKLKDQTARFTVTEMEGLWDTDNPEVQSRVGKYVAVHAITQ